MTTVQQTGSIDLAAQNNAAKTATNYITDIGAQGISVSGNNATSSVEIASTVKVKKSATSYSEQTADGLNVYADKSGSAVLVGSFGADGAQVGVADGLHTVIDGDSFDMFTDEAESNSIFHVGYPTGATVTDTFAGDGTTTGYMLSNTPSGGVSVTIDGTATSAFSVSGTTLTMTTAPASGAVIAASYPTAACIPYYTLGVRGGNAGKYSTAEGYNTTASGPYSHAEGYLTTASGPYSHAEGRQTTASGWYSHAGGRQTTASGPYSHAEGYNTTASESFSHAGGRQTTASGSCSHAEGYQTTASGPYSHAEGYNTTASKSFSHAEGFKTKALGETSHAEGSSSKAEGQYGHAEGISSTAAGTASHAEGISSANGDYSHAEGYYTGALEDYSHAEGQGSMASGVASHAQNIETRAYKKAQTAIGTYNKGDVSTATTHPSGDVDYGKYALIIGNGTESTSSNAMTVDWGGNVEAAGHYYAEGERIGHSWCYINSITDTSITAKNTDIKVPVNSLDQAKPSGMFEYVSSSKSVKCNIAGWYMVSIQAGFDNTATMSDDLVGIGVARVHSGTTTNITGPDYVRVRTNLDRALLMPTPVYFYEGDTFYPVVRNNSNARGVLHTMRFMVAPLIG